MNVGYLFPAGIRNAGPGIASDVMEEFRPLIAESAATRIDAPDAYGPIRKSIRLSGFMSDAG
jgi:hypothetical protein